MIEVPLVDLKAQHAPLRDDIVTAMTAVLDEGRFILGDRVAALEVAAARVVGTRHAIGVSSGTDALLAGLMALGVGPGDEVVTTPFTFFATAGVIARTGARPVFVDIRRDTYNLDVEAAEAACTERTKAIVPVHLYGQVADMDAIVDLARRRSLAVVEDACQALGASRTGHRAGASGDVGCFSFFPTKNVGALGDGGLVTTNDDALAEKVRLLRTHGSADRREYAFVGGNFRLDALQAAVVSVKLPLLPEWNAARRANAARYAALWARSGLVERGIVVPPTEAAGAHHIYHQYVVRVERREELRAWLADHRIGTGVYYASALHLVSCFSGLGYQPGDLPEAEEAAQTALALPVHPDLSPEQLEHVVETVAAFYS